MNAFLVIVALLVLLVVGVAGFGILAYNKLIKLRERYKNAFAQIDVQLKRRYDLIPNLVNAVKGYMSHERLTLEKVIAARNAAFAASQSAAADPANAAAVRELSGAESSLTALLGRLMVVKEDYPDLKADQQTARLFEELTSTENRIAFARQHYNDSVMSFNATRQSLPTVLIAGPLGFTGAALFEISEAAERQAVSVSLESSSEQSPV